MRVLPFLIVSLVLTPMAGADESPPEKTTCVGFVVMPYVPLIMVPPGHDSGYVEDTRLHDYGLFLYIDGPDAQGRYLYSMAGETVNGICLGRLLPHKHA
jgi:hypothetical protein